jgi:hypothetical protein
MPSDERIEQALEALSAQKQVFQSALAATIDQIGAYAHAHGAADNEKAQMIAMELGPFAANLVDAGEFSRYSGDVAASTNQALKTVKHAQDTLGDLADKGDELFVVDVKPGGSLWHSVAQRLSELGRAFAAARAFDLAKANGEKVDEAETLPFNQWSSRERRLAPPLVVTVDGADCRANGLADFLDGAFKMILLLRDESTPAPLVRLITPGTFVAQATDVAVLKGLGAWDGPGIAAVVPESAARFTHNPKGGDTAEARLKISALPEDKRRKPMGGVSVAQQSEELRQLKALGITPAKAAAAEEAEVPVNPADKLAAWLLTRADLDDVK